MRYAGGAVSLTIPDLKAYIRYETAIFSRHSGSRSDPSGLR